MSQVPVTRTPITMREYARAVIVAWRKELGVTPPKEAAGVLWAQYMIETGGSACWCWNIGNVKVTAAQVAAGVSWFDLPGTWEMIGGKRVVLKDGDPGRRFRAYPNLAEGMTEHLRFLRNRRYKNAWPSVEAGDCVGFACHLKASGYFTATAEAYARGMGYHHTAWMRATSFEDALAALDAETQPELPQHPSDHPDEMATPRIVDFEIVHKSPYDDLGSDDEPPEAA